MSEKTLLEKALEAPQTRINHSDVTDQEFELLMAVVDGRVSRRQAAVAIGKKKAPTLLLQTLAFKALKSGRLKPA